MDSSTGARDRLPPFTRHTEAAISLHENPSSTSAAMESGSHDGKPALLLLPKLSTCTGRETAILGKIPSACPARHLGLTREDSAGLNLSGCFYVADLNKPKTVRMGSMRNNIVDVTRTDVGIARRLKWDPNERDLALYNSKLSSSPLNAFLSSSALPDSPCMCMCMR